MVSLADIYESRPIARSTDGYPTAFGGYVRRRQNSGDLPARTYTVVDDWRSPDYRRRARELADRLLGYQRLTIQRRALTAVAGVAGVVASDLDAALALVDRELAIRAAVHRVVDERPAGHLAGESDVSEEIDRVARGTLIVIGPIRLSGASGGTVATVTGAIGSVPASFVRARAVNVTLPDHLRPSHWGAWTAADLSGVYSIPVPVG